MKQSGIYRIVNKINCKGYIGSAIDFKRRWTNHRWLLINNKHDNIYLQRAWNKYGEANFKFEIIEEVKDKTKLVEREQYWMDYCKAFGDGYNMTPKAGSQLGFHHSDKTCKQLSKAHKGKKFSIARKLRMQKAQQKIEHLHRKGKRHTKKTLLKMRLARQKFWKSSKGIIARRKLIAMNKSAAIKESRRNSMLIRMNTEEAKKMASKIITNWNKVRKNKK